MRTPRGPWLVFAAVAGCTCAFAAPGAAASTGGEVTRAAIGTSPPWIVHAMDDARTSPGRTAVARPSARAAAGPAEAPSVAPPIVPSVPAAAPPAALPVAVTPAAAPPPVPPVVTPEAPSPTQDTGSGTSTERAVAVAAAVPTSAPTSAPTVPAAGPVDVTVNLTMPGSGPGWNVAAQPEQTRATRTVTVTPEVVAAATPAATPAAAPAAAPAATPAATPAAAPAATPAAAPAVGAAARPTVTVTESADPTPSPPGPRAQEVTLTAKGVTADAETLPDLAYAQGSGAQRLDLYLPKRSGQAVALVVFVHGGAFSEGDKKDVPGVSSFLEQGYAVASVNYRLSGEAAFPAAVQDVKAAVRWLRAHAGTYGIDPSRFAVWGASAGGYLANMVGVSGGVPSGLDDPGLGNAEVSSRVQAVVSWYGPTDFTAMDAQTQRTPACGGKGGGHDDVGSPESRWLGTPVQSSTDLVKASNPIAWLPSQPAGTLPPFLLAHGGADCTVPPGQSTVLGQALTSVGVPVQVKIVDGAGHAEGALDEGLIAPTLEFVSKALGRPTTSPVTPQVTPQATSPATSSSAAESGSAKG